MAGAYGDLHSQRLIDVLGWQPARLAETLPGRALQGRRRPTRLFTPHPASAYCPHRLSAVVISLQVPKLSSLWTSSYGLILTIKLVFVITLLALACFNRFWLTAPVIRGDEHARLTLRRSVSAEVVIVVAIFAAVAGWRFAETPRAALASQLARLNAHLHSSSAMAQLEIAIQSAGTGSASISVTDQGHRVMVVKEVALRLSNPEQGIEPLKFKATPAPDRGQSRSRDGHQ
ncbi:hypothetical protein CWR43_00490 [Rhizobium sullae]|uniref:Copper resistance protein D domain-containing protein n=2 Tax=Rhizobium sullae TaxID=50338 RepID=A0A2N0DHE9_RHISU|nr:hypothetical protein CWR43_00490 [Rhizobium sullae]